MPTRGELFLSKYLSLRGPTRVGALIVMLPSLFMIEELSRQTTLSGMVSFDVLTFLFCALTFWCIRVIAVLIGPRGPQTFKRKWPWLVTPLCLGMILLAFATAWPLKIRFMSSRGALDQAVTQILKGQGPPETPCWIGSYRVDSIEFDFLYGGDSIAFEVGRSLTDSEYLVWSSIDEAGQFESWLGSLFSIKNRTFLGPSNRQGSWHSDGR